MPLESLACTKCGSTDLQEVKPATYFCNHCETVFKYVDPARLTVDHAPAFCTHGNSVQVQCQVCKTGMCSQRCDAVPIWAAEKLGGFVRTVGFGYVEEKHAYGGWVDGPFLSLGKLLKSLALTHGSLSHVCFTCVADAVPVAAEHVAAGTICETIRCYRASSASCPCCLSAFCQECSLPQVERDAWSLESLLRGINSSATKLPVIGTQNPERRYTELGDKCYVAWSPPAGTCGPCAAENVRKAAGAVKKICEQDYASVLVANGGDFMVPTDSARSASKKYYREMQRSSEAARLYAAEIGARMEKLIVIDGNCRRVKSRAGVPDEFSHYGILDERDRVMPAAASALTWTRMAVNR